MNILYFSWYESAKNICMEALKALGHSVFEFVSLFEKYDYDEALIRRLVERILAGNEAGERFDVVFSFNYFPDVSRAANSLSIPYAAWVYDSPHLTLQSETLGNPCNRVFLFDYALYEKYILEGFKTVRHLTLPARIVEIEGAEDGAKEIENKKKYESDITFLGSLYDGEQDQFGNIKTLPGYLSGYLEGVINAQKNIYGFDLIGNVIDDEKYKEISYYVKAELGEGYRKCGKEILFDMMRRKVTGIERREVLRLLGERFSVDLYSGKDPGDLPVSYKGYADYENTMPKVFYSSKININVSLRSIRTGIPLRVMDILGAGGFCLTNYQEEIAQYFENGVDLVWYESMDDLIEKAGYYLSHDEEREKIAAAGHEKVAKLFTYEKQLTKILKEIG